MYIDASVPDTHTEEPDADETDTAGVTVRVLTDVAAFRAVATPWLAVDPVGTNVIGTILAGSLPGGSGRPGEFVGIVAVAANGSTAGVGMVTPPFPLHLPAMPDDAVLAIAGELHAQGLDLPGVSGDLRATQVFVDAWIGLTGTRARLEMAKGVHVLDRLVPPAGVPGAARQAEPPDVELLTSWYTAFHRELHGDDLPGRDDPALLVRRIAAGRILLWEDAAGQPVSFAGWHEPAVGFGRVGPVYTPPEHRRHGYAAAVTAAATSAVLAARAACAMLYTDLANPTSNGVYARLGYRHVRDSSEWTFRTG